MGHYERVRCDNCNGTGTVGQYSGEGPKQCWSCGGTGYKGDVWVEDSSSSSSSYDSGSSSGGYSGGGGSRSAPASVPGQYEFEQGVSYENQGRFNDAVDSFTKALGRISYGKYKALAYVRRGQVYFELKQYDNAIEDLTTAIGHGYFSDLQNDTQYIAYAKLGDSYKRAGQREKAIEAYKESIYLGHSETASILASMGVQYSLVNHIEEKIANNINSPSYVWNLADKWERETGRKMTKDEQIRIAGKPFPKRPKPSSSSYSGSSYGEDSEGHPTLFGIIGAVVLGGIGYNTGRWVGAIIGGLIGWFVGRAIGSKISFGGGSCGKRNFIVSLLFGAAGGIGILMTVGWIYVQITKVESVSSLLFVFITLAAGAVLTFLTWRNKSILFFPLLLAAVFGWLVVFKVIPEHLKTAALTQTEAAATAATATTTITSNVNFRSGPSTDNAVIRQLQQGDTVTLTGETSGGWTEISHNGETGWVSSEFLK